MITSMQATMQRQTLAYSTVSGASGSSSASGEEKGPPDGGMTDKQARFAKALNALKAQGRHHKVLDLFKNMAANK